MSIRKQALASRAAEVEPRRGVQLRLLICDECQAVWATERDEGHEASRLDGEPCAYRWPGGKVCTGTVGPIWLGGRREKEADRFTSQTPRRAAYGGSWCEALGVPWGTVDLALVRKHYRARCGLVHPDVGGSHEDMVALNDAYRQALSELGQPPGAGGGEAPR